MHINFDILFMLLLLGCYSFTLVNAHIILSRVDIKTKITRRQNGEIRLKDIKILAITKAEILGPEARKAILLLKINRFIVFLFFAFLGLELLFKSNIQVSFIHLFRKW
jgi:hypothetical protein